MSLFKDISERQFVEQFWQRQAYFSVNVFADLIGIIDGDDLAGLACEDTIESRIISGSMLDGGWNCRTGPFGAADFAAMPPHNWTLLVQGVDQWHEQLKNTLNRFDFVPRWRLEDLMASYAPIGGSVGPHFDYYDVFLIQVSGHREWKLGQWCDETTDMQANDEVKLLAEFKAGNTLLASPGDMLYVPARLAHFGVATSDDCITLSVGFRAPSQKQLVAEMLENIVEQLPEHDRYEDSVDSIDQHPYKINQHAHAGLQSILQKVPPQVLQAHLYQSFGQLVTEPRYLGFEDEHQSITHAQLVLLKSAQQPFKLTHLSHSRLAFSETHLFANGEAFESEVSFSQAICDKELPIELSPLQLALALSLVKKGVISIDFDEC